MRPRKVILLVNDNEQEQSVFTYMLEVNGYRVVKASSGEEALAIFPQLPLVDLVVADYAMPVMNGAQLVNQLKQLASHVPMILLGDPQSMGGQIHLADALLAKKHVPPSELLERIKIMSARKRGPRKGTLRIQVEHPVAVA